MSKIDQEETVTSLTMTKTRWVVAGLMWFAIAINYIGDGLRDALDPRQRG